MHAVYLPESSTRLAPSAVSLNLSRAILLARAWHLVEPVEDFTAFITGSPEDIVLGL
jgi:hypothetical protein